MDFNDAIAAHLRWRMMLSHYVATPDRSLVASLVASTDRCELGRWLAGEGKQYSRAPEFASLIVAHAIFHRAASDIIRKADSGQSVMQDIALGLQSGYGAASSEIIKTLLLLRTRAAVAAMTEDRSPKACPLR